MIENQTGKHIKTLRSDNGGEFESHHFEGFCKEAGIKRQLTVPYNPQQNGVAKRKNITISEAAKAMLHDLELPTSLWAETTKTTVYLKQVTSCYSGRENSRGSIYSRETRCMTSKNLWMSCLYSCSKGEKDQK